MAACSRGHVDMVRLLLRLGFDPNSPNKEGEAPLHLAAYSGDLEVRMMVVIRRRRRRRRRMVVTMMMMIMMMIIMTIHPPLQVMELLLEGGAMVDPRSRYLETPLFYAARRDHPEAARLLLQVGSR
jgi:ankyrin repeat protein